MLRKPAHRNPIGGVLMGFELVRSRAACFCFFRITSWSFCFTSELATAPVNQRLTQSEIRRVRLTFPSRLPTPHVAS